LIAVWDTAVIVETMNVAGNGDRQPTSTHRDMKSREKARDREEALESRKKLHQRPFGKMG